MTKCNSLSAVNKTTAMSGINMQQSDSVDNTWRSCCWQHVKVVVIR